MDYAASHYHHFFCGQLASWFMVVGGLFILSSTGLIDFRDLSLRASVTNRAYLWHTNHFQTRVFYQESLSNYRDGDFKLI